MLPTFVLYSKSETTKAKRYVDMTGETSKVVVVVPSPLKKKFCYKIFLFEINYKLLWCNSFVSVRNCCVG